MVFRRNYAYKNATYSERVIRSKSSKRILKRNNEFRQVHSDNLNYEEAERFCRRYDLLLMTDMPVDQTGNYWLHSRTDYQRGEAEISEIFATQVSKKIVELSDQAVYVMREYYHGK